jgi:hypothetical protein
VRRPAPVLAAAVVAALLGAAPASAQGGPTFRAGAAAVSFTPPAFGRLAHDPADCAGHEAFTGPRRFAFEEPYTDTNGNGQWDPGEPYLDCNHDERWDGNFLGGGADSPRRYSHVLDPVGARALVVSHARATIAVVVVDQEGLFNVYQERIRRQVARDGYHLSGIFISATHDESAPDTLGISGVDALTSSVNAYFADYLVRRSAQAIERAYRRLRPARIRLTEAREPANLRQCWSSYPFVDDRLMPVLQAVGRHGATIATLADVSQHDESLGFNPDPGERLGISSDWVHFFRASLERRLGGVGIEMAGSVGSVETPEVFARALSTTPQRFVDESHPAGCRTLFDSVGTPAPLGYRHETAALGRALAGSVVGALRHAQPSRSAIVRGARADICIRLTNALFAAGAALGVFAQRPGYTDPNCTMEVPPAANGSTSGGFIKSEVATFRIGDGEFISVPGEVFPFTFERGFLGPSDMPHPQNPLPPWLLAHMRAPYRFVDGLGEDMVGYTFPPGNGVGVPGEPQSNPDGSDTDRFGCGHSDDSEAASSSTSMVAGTALLALLRRLDGPGERIVRGRYVLPGGRRSRDPLGGPELKCATDTVFRASGPATAVWIPGQGTIDPRRWMSLSGRPQDRPDRDTRGFFDVAGRRVWLDVYADLP